MKKINEHPVFRFVFFLILALVVSLGLHIEVLETKGISPFGNRIVLAYIINGFLAVVIFSVIYKLRIRQKENLGFVFMFGSMAKFLFFFLFFNSYYKLDGEISTIEFLTFFVPYSVSLFVETTFLIRLLNRLD